MSEVNLQVIQDASGIPKTNKETISEYIDRIAKSVEISEETVNLTKSYLNKQSGFTPDPEISSEEADAITEFLQVVKTADFDTRSTDSESVESSPSKDSTYQSSNLDLTEYPSSFDNKGPQSSEESADDSEQTTPDEYGVEQGGTKSNSGQQATRSDGFGDPTERTGPSISTDTLRRVWVRVTSPLYDIDAAYLLTLLAVGAYLYYFKLDTWTFMSYDEALYAYAARDILQNGNWAAPHLYWPTQGIDVSYIPFLEKPPGFIWLTAVSMAIFGVSEFAARFPSATFSIMTGGLAYIVGRHLFDRRTGLIAGVIWLTTPYVYAGTNGGRMATTDAAWVFFGTLFIFGVWIAFINEDDRGYSFVAVGALGALMVKGFAAGVYALVVIPICLIGYQRFFTRKFAHVVAFVTLPIAGWLTFAYIMYGDTLIYELVIQQVLQRASRPDKYPYLRDLPMFFDPWVYFLPGSLGLVYATVKNRTRDEWKQLLFVAWWAVCILVFFRLTGDHPWYIMGMYFPGAILVSRLVVAASRGSLAAIVSVWGGLALSLLFSHRFGLTEFAFLPRKANAFAPSGLTVGAILILMAILVCAWDFLQPKIQQYLTQSEVRVFSVAVPIILAILVSTTLAAPADLGKRSAAGQNEIGMVINSEVPPDTPVYIEGEASNASPLFGLSFYANRPLVGFSADNHKKHINASNSPVYAVVRQKEVPKIKKNGSVEVLATKEGSNHDGKFVFIAWSLHEEDTTNATRSLS
ncbi:glycosyltransferase family 39 protein [Haloarcula sp. CGMCC 1.2071]|uniref:glycosyltransferase family 39 protein n=1 Tax=Haloarcula sp. CGMCC 1.2071 TaxID=3111454 RepID=UPI00300F530B